MKQIIHEELQKLQEELSAIDAAVKHIAKAEEIATTVVKSTQEIHKHYETHLKNVLESYNSYAEHVATLHGDALEGYRVLLEEAVKHTQASVQDNVNSFAQQAKDIAIAYGEKAKDIQTYLEQFPSQQAAHLQNIQQQLEGAFARTTADLQEQIQVFTTKIQEIAKTYDAKVKDIHSYLEQFPTLQEQHLQNLQGTINDALIHIRHEHQAMLDTFSNILTDILHPLEVQVRDAQLALESGKALTTQNQRLLEEFQRIDLPSRVDKVDIAVTGISQGIQNILMRLETIERGMTSKMERLEKDLKDEFHRGLQEALDDIKAFYCQKEDEARKRSWLPFGRK